MGWVEAALGGGGLLACVFIAWQDFRERRVHLLWLLLLLGCGMGLLAVGEQGAMPASLREALQGRGNWTELGLNLGFVAVLMVVLGGYLRLRGMGFLNQTFGMGDLVFLVAAAPWLGLFQYVLFFTSGAMIGVLFGVFGRRAISEKGVPFAGLLAVWLVLLRAGLLLWAEGFF